MWSFLVRDKFAIINYKQREYQFYIRFMMINRTFNAHAVHEWKIAVDYVGRLHFYKFYVCNMNDGRCERFQDTNGIIGWICECAQATRALVWLFLISI